MFLNQSKLFSVLTKTVRSVSTCPVASASCFDPTPPKPIVALLDVLSTVGRNLALLLKQNPNIHELRIYQEEQDIQHFASDLNEIDTKTKVVPYPSNCLRKAVTGAHVVVSTGGCQEKHGETQKELFDKNMDNVRNVAMFLAEFNPYAVYCIAKPPVEALVPMVSEEYKKAETYDPRKIIGVTSTASMTASTFIGCHLRKDPADILCPIVGGLSPKTTIPVISQASPSVEYNPELYTQLQDSIANGEETLLCKNSMFCFSKAVAISRFVNLVVRAILREKGCVDCAFVAQPGHIGKFLPYMTSIIKLGPDGVASTHMPQLNELEESRLRTAVPYIIENIRLGQILLQGESPLSSQLKVKRKCDELLKKKVQECINRAGLNYTQ